MGHTLATTRGGLAAAVLFLVCLACAQPDRRSGASSSSRRRAAAVQQQGAAASPAPPQDKPIENIPVDARGRPILPLVIHDACEGEDCVTQFDALACFPTTLLASANDAAKVIARIKAGDTVAVNGRDLHVSRLGVVVLKRDYVLDTDVGDDEVPRRDTLRFTRNDSLFLVRYYDLGFWKWWYKGQTQEGSQFWARPASERSLGDMAEDSTNAVARSMPSTEDWWYVQPRKGLPGWWHADGQAALQSIFEMAHWDESCNTIGQHEAASDSTARDSTSH